ncbi:3-isopropylmalate dehydratase large subunit, partial [Muribaculum caecicola]
ASQCVLQPRPKTMRITINGKLGKGVTAKDLALYIIAQMSTGGATGYFVEYAGEAIRALSMEERMTVCNLSIEMGARGGMIAPDETTFAYVKGREHAPSGEAWDKAVAYWRTLPTDPDAVFDREITFDAANIGPRLTYGTNPGMGIDISETVPSYEGTDQAGAISHAKALEYMRFSEGQKLEGTKVDYVFLGSCTNGRLSDFQAFADMVKGRKKAPHITAWLVPGSQEVYRQIISAGIDKVLQEAGFELRQPGCSACLAMNDDKIPQGCLAVSTSNRNFEGRQGPGSRTILAGPLVAAAAAITGSITDPRTL